MDGHNNQKLPSPTCENGIWKGIEVTMPDDYFKLGEKIFERFRDFPETVGQIDGKTGEKETFKSMGIKAIKCALWLKKQGICKGDVVALCSGNHMDSWIPMVSSFYIGCIFNAWWDSCLDEDLAKYFIELTEPKIIFASEKFCDTITEALARCNNKHKVKVIVFGKSSGLESFTDTLKIPNDLEVEKFQCTPITNPADPIMILYTSGTTSHPKGVLYAYSTLTRIGNFESKRILTNTRNLWFSGLCWLSAVLAVISALISRSTMIVYDEITEDKACELIEKYKITWITMGASVANRLAKTKAAYERDLSSIIRASYGGGIAKKEVIEALHKIFKNAFIACVYGCTETGVILGGRVNVKKPTSCGNITLNSLVKLIDPDTGKLVNKSNVEGEICYKGPQLMSCYWKNPTATKEALDSEGWYHTGDLGYYDEDGDFFIVERIKELIKYRLHHVPPAAIESVIQDHPGVAEVAVVAKPTNDDVEQPMAFITKLPGAQVTENEIHELVNTKLHDRMKLRGGIVFLEKMPLLPSRKISKRDLRAMARKLAEMNCNSS